MALLLTYLLGALVALFCLCVLAQLDETRAAKDSWPLALLALLWPLTLCWLVVHATITEE